MAKVFKTLTRGVASVTRLAKVLNIPLPPSFKLRGLLSKIDVVEKTQGSITALSLWKYWYNCITLVVMQEYNYPKPPIPSRLNKMGFPKELRGIRELIDKERGNIRMLRLILTAFRSSDKVLLPVQPDLKSIITPSMGGENFMATEMRDFIGFLYKSPFFRNVKKDFNRALVKMKQEKIYHHFSTKSGISGPTLSNIHLQTLYFRKDEKLGNLLCDLSKFFYEEELKDLLRINQELASDPDFRDLNKDSDKDKILRTPGKLAFVAQGGGKSRCIAIGNYWVQNALYPLHKVMYKVLRHIAWDGTYDQHSQSSRVAKATSEGPVWSFDLSKATDRLPLEPQLLVMRFLHNKVGKIWGEILKSMTFEYEGQALSYQVGQPMGLYTSWASLALFHHALIHYCAWKVGKTYFSSYSVLGDDVAIWDKEVAEEYQRQITLLEVEVSSSKSFIPKDLVTPPFKGEFAKRLFLGGEEISGISPNVLSKGLESFWGLPELIAFLIRHNFPIEVETTLISRARELYRLNGSKARKLCFAFRINALLQAPYEALFRNNEEALRELTLAKLMLGRIDLLSESALQFWEIEEEGGLENALGHESVDENTGFARVLANRQEESSKLEKRMLKYIPDDSWSGKETEFFNQVKAQDETEYEDNILTKIKDVEMIPSSKFSDIMDAINNHDDRKQRRVNFLRNLTEHILAIPQESLPRDVDDW